MFINAPYFLIFLRPIRFSYSLRCLLSDSIRIQYRISDQNYSIENRCPIPLFIIIANTQLYLILSLNSPYSDR